MVELRPFQAAAKAALRRGFLDGILRQLLVAPTGSGKSVIAHDLVIGAMRRQTKVLFSVPRIQLVEQFSRRLFEGGIEHGIMQGDNTRSPYARCIVGCIDTIANRGAPAGAGLIIPDEAHGCAGSGKYEDLFRAHPNVPIIGLTATPWAPGLGREVDGLGKLFERLVPAASYSELIALGHLVDCDVYAPSAPDMTGARTQVGADGIRDWSDTVAAGRSNTPKLIGDIVEHWRRLAYGTPTVVFASTIEHSKAIVEAFNRAGIPFEHIDAYTKPDERREILARVDRGVTMGVSCVSLLAEGWDQPSIRTMILARPTRSLIRFIQMVGRILRAFDGKDRALLLDHSGSVLRLGHPTEDREYTLDDGSPRESNTSTEDAPTLEITKCPQCHMVPAQRWRVCPGCGYERVIPVRSLKEGDGNLVKVERLKREQKQAFWSQLLGYAQEKNKGSSWVEANYRAKFGVWARGMQDIPSPPSQEVRNWIKSRQIAWSKRQEKLRAAA